MAAFDRFEDIDAWKKARLLTQAVYRVTSEGTFCRDFALRDQIRRASISIMSNIAEGYERNGNKEFVQFLHVAKGSAGEVRAQLYVALDANHLCVEDFNELYGITLDISRLTSGLIRYLATSDMKGSKFT